MNRNILITNDDGINSKGIEKLAKAALKYGNVYVVAPDSERSAMSHRITLRETIDVKKVDFPVEGIKGAFAISGTPADCVRIGIRNIVEGKTDLILSGINNGCNCGSDTQYSATIGAALEGASSGIHSIAVSETFNSTGEIADAYLEKLLDEYIEKKLQFNQIWNINFPAGSLAELKGILTNRSVSPNSFYDDHFEEEVLPDGTRRLKTVGKYREDAPEGTDFRAIVDGYISIGIVNNLC
ncbi:MAG: 5'/3'-nucleotidase SurE [Butyrivibrio sp.]|nr:5'/3'-nucleotidase SurE [Butyrivibrio sp.]